MKAPKCLPPLSGLSSSSLLLSMTTSFVLMAVGFSVKLSLLGFALMAFVATDATFLEEQIGDTDE